MKLVLYLILFNVIVNSLPDFAPKPKDVEDPNNTGEQDHYDPNIAESGPIDENIPESDPPDENIPESDPPDENIPESDPPDENIPESDPKDENIPESDPPDENIPDSGPKDPNIPDEDEVEKKYKLITCSEDPCILKPVNDDDETTYVVIPATFQDCKIVCEKGNCRKKFAPLKIRSACNRTRIEIDDDSEEIDIELGDVSEIDDDISDLYTDDDFYSIKDDATVSCKSYACKKARIVFLGEFRYGSLVETSGRKALENGDIDCEYATNSCFLQCEIDDESEENSCSKSTVKTGTRDEDLAGCRGDCDDESAKVLRPPEPAAINCDSGEQTIKPSPGDVVVCTSGCKSCKVDCSESNCRGVEVYSGADETDIDCSSEKACENAKLRCGSLELEDELPVGRLPEDFSGTKSSCNVNCDGKVACAAADVCIVGKFINPPKVSANKIDAFQNADLKCVGNSCELDCAFDGCDGSLMDCFDGNDFESDACVCNDIDEIPDAPPVTNDGEEDQPDVTTPDDTTPTDPKDTTPKDPVPDPKDTAPKDPKAPYKVPDPAPVDPKDTYYYPGYYYDPSDQPDGPTCPIINSGKRSEPEYRQSSIANGKAGSETGGRPNKVAGITSMIVLAAIVGLLYWVIYKTKLCRRGSKYETDLIKESTYNTFGSAVVEMEES